MAAIRVGSVSSSGLNKRNRKVFRFSLVPPHSDGSSDEYLSVECRPVLNW
jgi:hypothetical protein